MELARIANLHAYWSLRPLLGSDRRSFNVVWDGINKMYVVALFCEPK